MLYYAILLLVLIITTYILYTKSIEHFTDVYKITDSKINFEISPLQIYFSWEAEKGVIITGIYYIALASNRFSIYDKRFGSHVRTYKTPFNNITSGTHYNTQLYLLTYKNNKNYLEILEMEGLGISQIDHLLINIDYINTISKQYITGDITTKNKDPKLVWIDRFRINYQYGGPSLDLQMDSWWGLVNYENDDVTKISLIRFEQDWTIDRIWRLPPIIQSRVFPLGICGGQFHRGSGLLFLIPYKKREIYIMYVNEEDVLSTELDLIEIIYSPFENGNIQFENDYMWGIHETYHEVVLAKLYYA